jgi:hypothetical protein
MTAKMTKLITQLTEGEKIRYVWQAKAEGLRLEDWVRKHLNEACDRAGTQKPDKE